MPSRARRRDAPAWPETAPSGAPIHSKPLALGRTPAAREALGSAALLVAAAAILGFNYVVVKWALLGAGPLTVALFRAVFGATAMIAICAATGTSLRIPLRRADLGAVALPACLMAGSQLAFTFGVANTAAGLASLLANTMPVCSALLAWVVVRERPTRAALVGITVAICGVGVAASVAGGGGGSHALGVGMMMVAVVTWAGSNVSLKRWRPVGGETAFATWMLIVGSFVFVPVAGIGESFAVHWSWKFVAEAVIAGGLGQVGFLFILIVLSRGSVMRASSVSFMVPVFAIVAGALFLNEPVRARELLGGAFIFAGVALVVFRGARRSAELQV